MGRSFDLEAVSDFLAVAEAGGISAGARLRGVPKQTVSRRLRALEADAGVLLLNRSARQVRLTPEGELLRDRARLALADLEETRRLLADRAAMPVGVVRLSAPILLGQTVLGRVAARIARRYPAIRLEISLADRRVDLVDEAFDAAIRVGPETDATLVSRTLAKAETILVASPEAIQRYGRPQSPEELAALPCILFGDAGATRDWRLQVHDRTVTVTVGGPLTLSSLKLCLDAAEAGAGFASVPAFITRDAIGAGRIERVLPDWRSGFSEIRFVYPSRRLPSARLRAVLDETVSAFTEIEM